jgi:hypothetical protein
MANMDRWIGDEPRPITRETASDLVEDMDAVLRALRLRFWKKNEALAQNDRVLLATVKTLAERLEGFLEHDAIPDDRETLAELYHEAEHYLTVPARQRGDTTKIAEPRALAHDEIRRLGERAPMDQAGIMQHLRREYVRSCTGSYPPVRVVGQKTGRHRERDMPVVLSTAEERWWTTCLDMFRERITQLVGVFARRDLVETELHVVKKELRSLLRQVPRSIPEEEQDVPSTDPATYMHPNVRIPNQAVGRSVWHRVQQDVRRLQVLARQRRFTKGHRRRCKKYLNAIIPKLSVMFPRGIEDRYSHPYYVQLAMLDIALQDLLRGDLSEEPLRFPYASDEQSYIEGA